MATGTIPNANTPQTGKFYSDSEFNNHLYATSTVGAPFTAAGGGSTANGNYVLFVAPCNCAIFGAGFSILSVGTTAAAALQCVLQKANNGANVSGGTLNLGNSVTIGTNTVGNCYSTGPFSFNVSPNGVNNALNTSPLGGVTANAGDILYAAFTGNTGLLGAFVEWVPTANAVISG